METLFIWKLFLSSVIIQLLFYVTVHISLFREVFWHEYAKIPRVARKNPIAEGDFCWIFARNCEDTEQLYEM